jgi:hypothetical protein
MRLPVLHGIIRRRILVNFRAEADAAQNLLPAPFRPKLHNGNAIVGICLIRLEHIRPAGLPKPLGLSSENAAHRIAVEWRDSSGALQEGVFIPRRDTGSRLNKFAGGRIFPGEHHAAEFNVSDVDGKIDFHMRARDGSVEVKLAAEDAKSLPANSSFGKLSEASAFFEKGSLGFSFTHDPGRLDALRLRTLDWSIQPLAVTEVFSSYYMDTARFPAGSIAFDHALIMRNIPHEWHGEEDFRSSDPKCGTPCC